MSFRSRLALGLILIASFAVLFILEKSMTVAPTPESQSVFLKHYDPAPVLNNFRDAGAPLKITRDVESTGNWGFASHRVIFHPDISVEPARRDAVFAALEHDAEEQIKRDGGKIIRQHQEEPQGFQVGYEIGPTRGAILVKPATRDPGGFKLEITIQEMWSEAVANRRKKS
jgi:hypothetical protein